MEAGHLVKGRLETVLREMDHLATSHQARVRQKMRPQETDQVEIDLQERVHHDAGLDAGWKTKGTSGNRSASKQTTSCDDTSNVGFFCQI
jgi:hypothetical protein